MAAANPRLLSENPIPKGRPSSWHWAKALGAVGLDHRHVSPVAGDVAQPEQRERHSVWRRPSAS